MTALAKTYSFTPGTSIVAAQVNENFDDVVDWATGAPTLSTSGSATTVSGTLSVTEIASFLDQVYLGGTTQEVCYEGNLGTAFETFLRAIPATADRIISLPDATGTVALTSDITTAVTAVTGTAPIVSSGGYTPVISITTNDAQLILNNTVFN
jgi:hypothetical protein